VGNAAGPTMPERSVPASPATGRTLANRRLWERRYRTRLRLVDLTMIAVATGSALAAQLLVTTTAATASVSSSIGLAALTAAVWVVTLSGLHTRDPKLMGSGTGEYRRVAHATVLSFGLIALAVVAFQVTDARYQLFIAFPIGITGLLLGRRTLRRWLLRQRHFGHYVSRTLVVGRREDVEYVIGRVDAGPVAGFLVVGASIEGAPPPDDIVVGTHRVAVLGGIHDVAHAAAAVEADTIIVAGPSQNDSDYVRRLSWELEGTAAELVLSSKLVDVAGPRISFDPIDGLPLIRVQIPTFEGGQHVLKRGLDILVGTVGAALTLLMTPFIAAAIALDSPGPVFYRQERVGRNGRRFDMVKFRTMRVGADAEVDGLLAANEGAGPLFKMKEDPRVTRVGRVLRKYSLDELPQFFNVLGGDMSAVGPRPPLPREVMAYGGVEYRRLYIKPGITGLWQVSGRSDLDWDESVRLDLYYVDNWSPLNDLSIMWRTVRVMLQPSGAY
jgi:exopolysaccharide biosynthesis polyprenyl glycosylphosphotransferase